MQIKIDESIGINVLESGIERVRYFPFALHNPASGETFSLELLVRSGDLEFRSGDELLAVVRKDGSIFGGSDLVLRVLAKMSAEWLSSIDIATDESGEFIPTPVPAPAPAPTSTQTTDFHDPDHDRLA